MKKNYIVKFTLAFLTLLFVLFSCSIAANSPVNIIDVTEEPPKEEIPIPKKLTLLVYMAADNDLESYAINNLKQMEHATYEGMNVLVLLDRAEGYDQTNGDWTDTRLFEVTHDDSDGNFIVSSRLDCPILGITRNETTELDMADYNVLRNFIKFAQSDYKAEKYALVIWGHGTGWRYTPINSGKAVSIDDKTNSYMSVLNEGKALKEMGISVVGFDSCFGGVLENLYEIREDVTYTVASPDITPSSGWDYKKLLEEISRSNFTEEEIAEIMSESSSVKTSVYINSKLKNVFIQVEEFSQALSASIDTDEKRNEILNLLFTSESYSYSQYPCDMFLDIFSMAELFKNSESQIVAEKSADLQKALINAGKTTNSSNLMMGIYFMEKTSSQTFATQHPAAYMKKNDSSQCSFINDSHWWVPTSTQNTNSLLDVLFYKSF